jgi:hypothetical protein
MPFTTQHDFVDEHWAAPVQSRRTALPEQTVVQPGLEKPPGPQQAEPQSSLPSHVSCVFPGGHVTAHVSAPEVPLTQQRLPVLQV